MTLTLLASCGRQRHTRSVYYWKTTLVLDSAERNFLKAHNVNKIYCRYFDVVDGEDGLPRPNATMAFEDSFPHDIEVVPVVYVLNACMKRPDSNLAAMIFKRIMQMNAANDVKNVREIQIDCDWTLGTRQPFFAFMGEMRKLCHANNLRLSSTIRLHQLSQEAPPADHGVLMVYNTGDVTKLSVSKPILDIRDVMPYVHYLKSYKLSLSTAYPLFSWRVLFRGGKYVGIMHGDDDLPVLPGDSVATRQPELDDILSAKKTIGDMRPDANNEVILYDLGRQSIDRFTTNDIKLIYGQ